MPDGLFHEFIIFAAGLAVIAARMSIMLKEAISVFIGSGAGGVLRWLLSHAMTRLGATYGWTAPMPWATLAVNLVGCFIIGIVYGLASRGALSPSARALLGAGLCGGLTTFSTFTHENLSLLQQGEVGMMGIYSALSLALGLMCAWLGHICVR